MCILPVCVVHVLFVVCVRVLVVSEYVWVSGVGVCVGCE